MIVILILLATVIGSAAADSAYGPLAGLGVLAGGLCAAGLAGLLRRKRDGGGER